MADCMSIFDWLDTLIKDAMRAGDKEMLALYRLVKSEMVKASQDPNKAFDHIAVYKSMKKKLIEEISALEQAGRDTNTQHKHLNWIENQLPQPVSEREIDQAIKEYVLDCPTCNVGSIMTHLKVIYSDRTIDMGYASKKAKEALVKGEKNV